jgi:hypothetical protein
LNSAIDQTAPEEFRAIIPTVPVPVQHWLITDTRGRVKFLDDPTKPDDQLPRRNLNRYKLC